jgi:antagonist of KipI
LSAAFLEIVRPGILATVQDLGRYGLGRFGVAPSGALDPLSLEVANRLVGNPPGAAALELTGPGFVGKLLAPVTLALAGADLGASLDGRPLPPCGAFAAAAGSELRLPERRRGSRSYLAVAGGIAAPLVLGSSATDLSAGIGGLASEPSGRGGKPLQRGALVPRRTQILGEPPSATAAEALCARLDEAHADPFTLRVILDEDGEIPPKARARFLADTFTVSPQSNRAGLRLAGVPLPTLADPRRRSEPVAPGLIQLPADGLPILLLADRNTTGGYPRLGHLVSADRAKAGQLWPGDRVRFSAAGFVR